MNIYLIYKRNENDKEDTFIAYTHIKNLAKLFIIPYKELYIKETEMDDAEYKILCFRFTGKELKVYKGANTFAMTIICKSDAPLLFKGVYDYDNPK